MGLPGRERSQRLGSSAAGDASETRRKSEALNGGAVRSQVAEHRWVGPGSFKLRELIGDELKLNTKLS